MARKWTTGPVADFGGNGVGFRNGMGLFIRFELWVLWVGGLLRDWEGGKGGGIYGGFLLYEYFGLGEGMEMN